MIIHNTLFIKMATLQHIISSWKVRLNLRSNLDNEKQGRVHISKSIYTFVINDLY